MWYKLLEIEDYGKNEILINYTSKNNTLLQNKIDINVKSPNLRSTEISQHNLFLKTSDGSFLNIGGNQNG